MIEFVVVPSSQNFHINIFTSNINGYKVTKERVVLAFCQLNLMMEVSGSYTIANS